jgi:hypothetical protein
MLAINNNIGVQFSQQESWDRFDIHSLQRENEEGRAAAGRQQQRRKRGGRSQINTMDYINLILLRKRKELFKIRFRK